MNVQNVLLVGAGPMAQAYHSALTTALHDWNILVAGRGEESARAFFEKTGTSPGTGSLEDQLTELDSSVKTAIVAVPVDQLAPVVGLLLDAGFKRILVEKPGAIDEAQARTLAKLDTDNRTRVAYNRRFLPSSQLVRKAVREDGGVTSFTFEFTELSERVAATHHHASVKSNWVFANSSHVIDLAFNLGGAEEDFSDVEFGASLNAGALDWHPRGSRFAGCGRVKKNTLFTWNADWCSGGGWSVELCTPKRRLIMRPLETVVEQQQGQFKRVERDLPVEEGGVKPGLPGMLHYFLLDERDGTQLPTIREQAKRLKAYDALIGGKS